MDSKVAGDGSCMRKYLNDKSEARMAEDEELGKRLDAQHDLIMILAEANKKRPIKKFTTVNADAGPLDIGIFQLKCGGFDIMGVDDDNHGRDDPLPGGGDFPPLDTIEEALFMLKLVELDDGNADRECTLYWNAIETIKNGLWLQYFLDHASLIISDFVDCDIDDLL